MKIAEYKQIDEHIEEYEAIIPAEYEEQGNIIIQNWIISEYEEELNYEN